MTEMYCPSHFAVGTDNNTPYSFVHNSNTVIWPACIGIVAIPMKKKQLERLLQTITSPVISRPRFEQYLTPAAIAADLLYTVYGDIYLQRILDLGCGTGMLAIGASLLGAQSVEGIDIDKAAVHQARLNAEDMDVAVTFHVSNVEQVTASVDTVIMNPPFGAQRGNRHADRLFLEKAVECAPIVYSLHLHKTIPFLERLVTALGRSLVQCKTYKFPLPHQFSFHTRRVTHQNVTLVRIQAPRR